MARYVVLTMEDKGSQRRLSAPRTNPEQKSFMLWKVGDVVRKKGHRDPTEWVIQTIDGQDQPGGGSMGYKSVVALEFFSGTGYDPGFKKTLRGATMQNMLEHAPQASDPVHATMPKDGTPIAFNVDLIRNFYPRKGGRKGTRIMTCNGVAYAVTEEFDDVLRQVVDAPSEDAVED